MAAKTNLPVNHREDFVGNVYGLVDCTRESDFQKLGLVGRHVNCSVPVDDIYAFRGLLPADSVSLIVPDSTLPSSGVYRKTFLDLTKHTGNLSLLQDCSLFDRRPPGLAWVPDYSAMATRTIVNQFCASGQSCVVV